MRGARQSAERTNAQLDNLLDELRARDERSRVVERNLSTAEAEYTQSHREASSKRLADMRAAEEKRTTTSSSMRRAAAAAARSPTATARSPTRQREIDVGWRPATDPATSRTYYHNVTTGAVTWEPPFATGAAFVPVAMSGGERLDLGDLLWDAQEKKLSLELNHRRETLAKEEKALLSTRQAVAHILQWTPGLGDDVLRDMQQRLHALGTEIARVRAEQRQLNPQSLRRARFAEEMDMAPQQLGLGPLEGGGPQQLGSPSRARAAARAPAAAPGRAQPGRGGGWAGVRLRRDVARRFQDANGPAMVADALHRVLVEVVGDEHPEATHVVKTAVEHAVHVAVGTEPEVTEGPAASALTRWGGLTMATKAAACFKRAGGPAVVGDVVEQAVVDAVGGEHPEVVAHVKDAVMEAVQVAVGDHHELFPHPHGGDGGWEGVRKRINVARRFQAPRIAAAAEAMEAVAQPGLGPRGWNGVRARLSGTAAFTRSRGGGGGGGGEDARNPPSRGWGGVRSRLQGTRGFRGSLPGGGGGNAADPKRSGGGWGSIRSRLNATRGFRNALPAVEASSPPVDWPVPQRHETSINDFFDSYSEEEEEEAAAVPKRGRGGKALWGGVRLRLNATSGFKSGIRPSAQSRWKGMRLRYDAAQRFKHVNGPAVVQEAVAKVMSEVIGDDHPEAAHVVRSAVEQAVNVAVGDAPEVGEGAAASALARWGGLQMALHSAARFKLADGPAAVELAVEQAMHDALGSAHPDAAKTVMDAVAEALEVAVGDHPEIVSAERLDETFRSRKGWSGLRVRRDAAHRFRSAGGGAAVERAVHAVLAQVVDNDHPEAAQAVRSATKHAISVALGDHPEVASGEKSSAGARWAALKLTRGAAHRFKKAGGPVVIAAMMKKAVHAAVGSEHPEMSDAVTAAVTEAVAVAVGIHPDVDPRMGGAVTPSAMASTPKQPPMVMASSALSTSTNGSIMLFKNVSPSAIDVYCDPHHHSIVVKMIQFEGVVLVLSEQVRVKSEQTHLLVNWMQLHDGVGWVHEMDPRTGARSFAFVDNVTNGTASTFAAIENGVASLAQEKSTEAVALLMEAARRHALPKGNHMIQEFRPISPIHPVASFAANSAVLGNGGGGGEGPSFDGLPRFDEPPGFGGDGAGPPGFDDPHHPHPDDDDFDDDDISLNPSAYTGDDDSRYTDGSRYTGEGSSDFQSDHSGTGFSHDDDDDESSSSSSSN